MPVTEVDETTATGTTDLPPLDTKSFPEGEIIAGPVSSERKPSAFETLQRRILKDLNMDATQGTLMLTSDILVSVAQLEFVDAEVLDEQATRLVEIRERENPNARQMWGPRAIKIARKGLELRLKGEAPLLEPKAA